MSEIQILDIRGSKDEAGAIPHLPNEILQGLLKPPGHRTLPSEILYDEVGLKLYNGGVGTSWSEWYYLFPAEKQILDEHGHDIAKLLKRSSKGEAVIIELGAGSLEKTSRILSSLAHIDDVDGSEMSIRYYALDLERSELVTTLESLQKNYGQDFAGRIATMGMWGTYDDGIRLIEHNELGLDPDIPVHILFLGGTIGNFSKGDGDVAFLKNLPLKPERGDTLLLGIDRVKPREAIDRAYNFSAAVEWFMNGLKVAGRVLTGDQDFFELENWDRYARFNEEIGRMEIGYTSRKDQTIRDRLHDVDITFSKDEDILVMCSNKYTDDEIKTTLERACLRSTGSWMDTKAQYYLYSLRPENFKT
ncbi:histidine-specific methyltransferase [Lyophyllum atratum]|nr:histidine-specific methyltransferase [Lyophyllum atratum]